MSEVHEVRLARLGDTVDGAVVIEWLVPPGAIVSQGDPLIRLETDKVEVDVAAPVSGVVVSTHVADGDEIATGDLMCRIQVG